MRIITARRISQIFFFLLFLWFCTICTIGEKWWELRGWPVNLFLYLDPLACLGMLLTTGSIYLSMLSGVATAVLTIFLGRFFCGWICPFGTMHHFAGYIFNRKSKKNKQIQNNQFKNSQKIKYLILIFILATSFIGLVFKTNTNFISGSLQTGLLDPIPLAYRSINLIVQPFFSDSRYYRLSFLTGSIFITTLLLNFITTRFYCKILCPLGALLAILSRFSIWRIGKTVPKCTNCLECEKHCAGGCNPSGTIRISECILCMNCIDACYERLIKYRIHPSESGEILLPEISKRKFIISAATGVLAIPILRLDATSIGPDWNPYLIRPPGALPEKKFLQRCIKCGQCMRICPTNVIQPSGLKFGIERLWTPVLNYKIGTSGCQQACIACGHICPTGAIAPLSVKDRFNHFSEKKKKAVKIGTAFINKSRCLPWAMDKPCLVCEENCPVSPKAIFTRKKYITIKNGFNINIKKADNNIIELEKSSLMPNQLSSGDFYLQTKNINTVKRVVILGNTENIIFIHKKHDFKTKLNLQAEINIQILLFQPFIDPANCIGCGICEHECPVSGKTAIKVTAENESRDKSHSFLL